MEFENRPMEIKETKILTLSADDVKNATVIFTKDELRSERAKWAWVGVMITLGTFGFFAILSALTSSPYHY